MGFLSLLQRAAVVPAGVHRSLNFLKMVSHKRLYANFVLREFNLANTILAIFYKNYLGILNEYESSLIYQSVFIIIPESVFKHCPNSDSKTMFSEKVDPTYQPLFTTIPHVFFIYCPKMSPKTSCWKTLALFFKLYLL